MLKYFRESGCEGSPETWNISKMAAWRCIKHVAYYLYFGGLTFGNFSILENAPPRVNYILDGRKP